MAPELGLWLRLQGNQRRSGSWLSWRPTAPLPSSRYGATVVAQLLAATLPELVTRGR